MAMVNLLGLALLLIATATAADPCPKSRGWLSVGSTGDCVFLSDSFLGSYRQAEAKCRSLGDNKDFHLTFLRDTLFVEQLEAALNTQLNVTNINSTYWIAAHRNLVNNRVIWLNDTYIDGSLSPLRLVFDPSPTDAKGFGYLILQESIEGNSTTNSSSNSSTPTRASLQMRFDKSESTPRRALCARQAVNPAVPSSNLQITGGYCPKIAGKTKATVHYISDRCYAVVPGIADDACASLGSNYLPAMLNDWTAQQVATVLADKHPLVFGLRFVPGRGYLWHNQSEKASVLLTAWSANQPATDKACVAIGNGTATWRSLDCNANSASLYSLCHTPASVDASNPFDSKLTNFLNSGVSCLPGFVNFDSSCYYLGDTPIAGNSSITDWCSEKYNASAVWFDRPAQLALVSLLGLQPNRYYAIDKPVSFDAGWLSLPDSLPQANGSCLAFSTGTGGLINQNSSAQCANLLPACRYPKPQSETRAISHSPTAATTAIVETTCPRGFILADNKCLATSSNYSDWHNANIACQGLFPSAFVASLHSSIKASVVAKLLPTSNTYGAWLGLSIRRSSGLLYPTWTDSTQFDYYPPHSANSIKIQSSFQCAYVLSDSSKGFIWHLTNDCNAAKRLVLCQAAPNVTNKYSTPVQSTLSAAMTTMPPVKTATPKVLSFAESCQSINGQRLSDDGRRCYSYRVLTNKTYNWFEAFAACQKIDSSNASNLASIESESENNFVRKLHLAHGLVWLGLNEAYEQVPDKLTTWSDGTPVQYVNFDNSKPDLYGQCGAMMTQLIKSSEYSSSKNLLRSGLWYDRDCGESLSVVCKTLVSKLPDQDASTSQPSTGNSSKVERYCPADWLATPDNTACYRLLPKPARFADARSSCQSLDGDLASYQTSGQHDFLVSLVASLGRRAGLVWLGLQWAGSAFNWLDGSKVNFLVWPHAPSIPSTHCLATRYHPLLSKSGYHLAELCSLPLPALCRRPLTVIPPSSPQPKICKDGYVAFNGTWCYRFHSAAADFETAQTNCKNDSAELLWLEASSEVHFIRSLASSISNPPPSDIWLNLRSNTEQITGLNWATASSSDSDKFNPVRFDYVLPEFRHYNLDKLSGCYGYRLYNRATPSVMGLNRISGGPAEDCGKPKPFVCKAAAIADLASPDSDTNHNKNIGCYGVAKRYSGYASRSIDGRECVRWDLVRLIYEQTDVYRFYNNTNDSNTAMHLLPIGSPFASEVVDIETDNSQETLGEAANFCRSPPTSVTGGVNGLALGVGRPVCFARHNLPGNKNYTLKLEFCPVPLC
uniref:C-type lectin domain-containing protein n=1 Tax=Macrostomum lignano TaxID=282301 RepID=A0A1I8G5S8_9PLAT